MRELLTPSVEPFFLAAGDSRRFAVKFAPAERETVRGALLFIPPFAEEMNKARRMMALGARALAVRGWTTLLLDPFGTGDSPGEFEEATWEAWIEDVVRAHRWLSDETGAVAGLWALRGGALLASAALPRIGQLPRLLLWQPMTSGKMLLQQFLRVRVAAAALGPGARSESTRDLLARLRGGESIEVAGYRLSPELALPLHEAELTIGTAIERLAWFEVSASDLPVLTPASDARVRELASTGVNVEARAVHGAAFWLSQEIEECQALIEETLSLLAAT